MSEIYWIRSLINIFRNPRFIVPLLAIGAAGVLAGAGRAALGGWLMAAIVVLAVVLVFLLTFLIWNILAREREKRLRAGTEARETLDRARVRDEEEGSLRALHHRFEEGLAAIRRSAVARDLPWYLLIGDPGSGKSSLLRESGLDLPAEHERLVDGAPTAGITWWLTNQATLIEVSGRYPGTEDGADRRAWRQLVRLIRRHGPRRPLSGVLVALPVPSLVGKTEKETEVRAHLLRRRINEINDELRYDVPTYFFLTHADRIDGLIDAVRGLPHARLDEAFGWTNARRSFDDAGERWVRGFDPVIETIERALPSLLMQEPDPESRRRIFSFPQELSNAIAAGGTFLSRVFERSVYARTPFLRGVYLTSAAQSGPAICSVATELGHRWAADDVSARALERSLFVRDVFRSIVIDPDEAALAQKTRELPIWIRRTVLGLVYSAGALALTLTATTAYGHYRGIRGVADDVAAVLQPSPRLETLDRLRRSVESEESRIAGSAPGMGLDGHVERALDRAKLAFSLAFHREQERPAKINVIGRVRDGGPEAFPAMAEIALDLAWLESRGAPGRSARPTLSTFAEIAHDDPEAADRFDGSYHAWVRWAPSDIVQLTLDRERDALEAVTPRLLRIDSVEAWCESNPEACPVVRYSDLGITDRPRCGEAEVPGAYTRRAWGGLVHGLLRAMDAAGSASRIAVEQFQEGFRDRYEAQWRSFLLCAPHAARSEVGVAASHWVELIDTVATNTAVEGLWVDANRPEWIALLAEIRREAPADDEEEGPWTLYRRILSRVGEDAERALEDPELAFQKARGIAAGTESVYREALDLVETLVPADGEKADRELRVRLRTLLELPILDGFSAMLRSARRSVERRWRSRIYAKYSGQIDWAQLEALYQPQGGALERFRREVVDPFYEDGRARSLLEGRGMPFGRNWLGWMGQAETITPWLFSSTPRAVRLDGIPSTIQGAAGLFVTRRELVLRCGSEIQRFTYREGTGSHRFSWTPQCGEVELQVWVRDAEGRELELEPRLRWTGATSLVRFVKEAVAVDGERLEWTLDYPSEGVVVTVRYACEGCGAIRGFEHVSPPRSVWN